MKYILILHLLIFSNFCFGQLPKELRAFEKETRSRYKLPVQTEPQIIKLKKEFLRTMYNDTSYFLCKNYEKTFEKHWNRNYKSTYISDFDQDGDYDALYFGVSFPPSENSNAVIYFKTHSGYIEKHLGIFIDTMYIDSSGVFIQSSFWLPSDEPAEVMQYRITSQLPNQLSLLTNEIFSYYSPEDSLMQKTDIILRFPEKKEFYFSANPDLESIKKYNIDNNETIGTIPKNYDLHAYNYTLIEGKIWYYVVLPFDDKVDIVKYYRESSYGKIEFLRGWICGD